MQFDLQIEFFFLDKTFEEKREKKKKKEIFFEMNLNRNRFLLVNSKILPRIKFVYIKRTNLTVVELISIELKTKNSTNEQ